MTWLVENVSVLVLWLGQKNPWTLRGVIYAFYSQNKMKGRKAKGAELQLVPSFQMPLSKAKVMDNQLTGILDVIIIIIIIAHTKQ